jgi:DNA-binding CsgD family transcriptional regulator
MTTAASACDADRRRPRTGNSTRRAGVSSTRATPVNRRFRAGKQQNLPEDLPYRTPIAACRPYLPRDALDEAGYKVLAAPHGESALARIAAHLRTARQLQEALKASESIDDETLVARLIALFRLTLREAEVLFWVIKGKTNRDIGEILGTSPRTVNKHLDACLRETRRRDAYSGGEHGDAADR